MIILHCHETWLNIHFAKLSQANFKPLQQQSNNARMNWLPFKALYNCQCNTQMRDCQASSLRLPLSFQYEYIITLCHLMYFSSSHVFNSMWVSVVQHCERRTKICFISFSGVDSGPLKYFNIAHTATKDTGKSICHVPHSTIHYGWLTETL